MTPRRCVPSLAFSATATKGLRTCAISAVSSGSAIGGGAAVLERQSPTRRPASAWHSRSACCSSTTAASAGVLDGVAGTSTLIIWEAGRMAFAVTGPGDSVSRACRTA